ncbi:hypothetical protein PMIN01_05313 [Paraphaeosphaeria minitans]|uniref:Uncharacterized protein n=1 Tax=Paraphaeosphaeria minitans TaxID=565426 RepID=A0A9P6GLC6_9PLEO|nr:hypothetical protein PMIN01_05313 [Paraphaeosphaeria minitans]
MHLLTTFFLCLGISIIAMTAGIPPNIVTATFIPNDATGLVATPTIAQEPNLISPNMAPIVSGTPEPHIPPPKACGQAVQMTFIGSTWILPNACHPFTERGDIPAPVSTRATRTARAARSGSKFCLEGEVRVQMLMRERSGSDCTGKVAWSGKIPSGLSQLKFPFGQQPYSYECLDFESNWP